MLGEAGIPGPAPGIKAQPPHRHRLILGLVRAFGLDEDGLCTPLVLRQLGQQLRAQPRRTVGGQHGKVIQLAHLTARRAHHEQVCRQCFAIKHAPCVSGAVGFAVQDHAQGFELRGREIPAHLVQIDTGQLFFVQLPPAVSSAHRFSSRGCTCRTVFL